MHKILVLAAAAVFSGAALAGPTPAPANAYLYIGWPNDGQVLPAGKPFRVWFGLRNMGVAPKDVKFPDTGHHHLLVDTDLPPPDEEIPSDRNHIHFGAGQTETMLELPPGKHTLQLLMGDDKHIPHNPPVHSKKITITVKWGEDLSLLADGEQMAQIRWLPPTTWCGARLPAKIRGWQFNAVISMR